MMGVFFIVEKKRVYDRELCLALSFRPARLHILLKHAHLEHLMVYARSCVLRYLGVNLQHPF